MPSLIPEVSYAAKGPRGGNSFASDFRFVGELLREKGWIVALSVLVSVVLGAAYIVCAPRIYSAQAVIEVEPGEARTVSLQETRPADDNTPEALKTVEQTLTSPEVILRVVRRNHLEQNPKFLPELKRPCVDAKIVEAFTKKISVSIRHGTRLIDVSVQDRDAQMAQSLAGMLVAEFTQQSTDSHHETVTSANEMLEREAERLKAKLADSERALEAYREQHHAVSLEDKENVVVERLRELNTALTAAKNEQLRLETEAAVVLRLANEPPELLRGVASVANAPAVVEVGKKVTEAEAQFAAVRRRYLPLHPNYIAAQTAANAVKAEMAETLRKAGDAVVAGATNAKITEQKLETAMREQEGTALELSKLGIAYGDLTRNVESDRVLYESLLRRIKLNDATKDAATDTIRVVSGALLPDKPIWPRKTRILFLALLGGLAFGCGLCFAMHAIDTSFKSVDDARLGLGLRALGVIPRYPFFPRATRGMPLLLRDEAFIEPFRGLRATLSLLPNERGQKVFLFTSAEPAEGKTFCSINASVAFAQVGLKTLLIDADLRRHAASARFFNGSKMAGLAEFMAGGASLSEAVVPTEVENLFVIPAGMPPEGAGEILAGDRFPELLQRAGLEYDRIVVDTAPVNAVSDTLLIARYADCICLVVRARKTHDGAVQEAAQKLEEAGSRPVGFIFNDVPRSSGSYYGYPYPEAKAEAGLRRFSLRGPTVAMETAP